MSLLEEIYIFGDINLNNMKKLITLLALAFCLNAGAQTPYVAIPDSNFVHYLKTIVPTAFKGDSLNTSSTLVTTSTKTINVLSKSISNLSGVQYFTSLDSLICGSNPLTSLPSLPNSLTILNCETSLLTSLPTLPNSLIFLGLFNNSLTTLPVLPTSLQRLDCSYNSLTTLPSLPNSLVWLHCNNNSITCFPTFPNSISSCILSPNSYNCLPNYIPAMGNDTTIYPLCAAGNSNGCAVAGIEQIMANKDIIVLNQNVPNPFAEQTVITYNIPQSAGAAQLVFYDALGRQIKTVDITTKGAGQLNVYANDLTNGIYSYTLIVDGNIIGTKKMVKQQ